MRCEGTVLLDGLDTIGGGIEAIVVETHGCDGFQLLKEEGAWEVAVGSRIRWNVLVIGIMESNEWEYERFIIDPVDWYDGSIDNLPNRELFMVESCEWKPHRGDKEDIAHEHFRYRKERIARRRSDSLEDFSTVFKISLRAICSHRDARGRIETHARGPR